jgi:hypothetical protein
VAIDRSLQDWPEAFLCEVGELPIMDLLPKVNTGTDVVTGEKSSPFDIDHGIAA